MASIQMENGHGGRDYYIQDELLSNSQTNKAICSVCGKQKPNEMLDLSGNDIMRDTLITYYKMRPSQVQDTLSALCVQCVYKINIQREMARTLELRLHQRNVTNNKNQTNSSAPNQSIIITRNARTRLNTGVVNKDIGDFKTSTKHVKSIMHPVRGSRTTLPETTTFFNQNEVKSDDKSSNMTSASSPKTALLNTVETSSKAKIKNLVKDCEYGVKVCFKFNNCNFENVKSSTNDETKSLHSIEESSSTTSTDTAQNSSMLEVICERTESAFVTESGCHVSHQQLTTQPNRLICSHCERAYLRRDFYKKHIRRCKLQHPYSKFNNISKSRAAVSSNVILRNRTDDTLEQSLRLKGLSKKSSCGRCYYCAYCDETKNTLSAIRIHQLKHLPNLECVSCGQVFNAHHNYEFHIAECNSKLEALNSLNLDEKSSQSKDQHSRRTRSATRSKSKNHATETSVLNGVESLSVLNANCVKPHRVEGVDWVDGSELNESLDCGLQISTYKEYDLYLLDAFKLQVQLNFFRCFEPECKFTANDLFAAILHDYKEHWNRSWYFCRKCDCMFTKKVHLDYHLHLQNTGRYVCFKCAKAFSFQHELDRHLIRHDKSINFRCNYCHLEYLSEIELIKHCDLEKHNPNDERTLVTIDKELTIANSMPKSANNEGATKKCGKSNESSVRFINMNLPSILPTRSSTRWNINRHVIGDFEFKNQITPNCAGCKYED